MAAPTGEAGGVLGAEEIVRLLDLQPNATCGFVRVTFTSPLDIAPGGLPAPFADGRPLVDKVRGRLRYELRATWLGGMRILDKLERRRFDSLHHRPTLGLIDAGRIALATARWRPAPRAAASLTS